MSLTQINKRITKLISWSAVIFIFVVAFIYIWYFYKKVFPYTPLGWDAPYYIYKTQLLRAQGIFTLIASLNGVRVGYTICSLAISIFFGISARSTETIFPLALQIICATEFAYLAYLSYKRIPVFIVTYILTLFSFGLNDIVLRNNSDNLFAITLVLGALIIWVWHEQREKIKIWPLVIIGCILFFVGITHLETLLVADSVFLFSAIYDAINKKSLKAEVGKKKKAIIVIFVANFLVLIAWSKYLLRILLSYKSVVNTAGVGKSVATSVFNLINFSSPATYSGLYIILPLILISLILTAKRIHNGNAQKAEIIMISWISTMLVMYMYFQLTHAPYNFVLRIIEITPINAMGLLIWWNIDQYISLKLKLVTITGMIILTLMNINSYFLLVKHDFVPVKTFAELNILRDYVEREKPDNVYVFVSTKKEETSLGAHQGMWNNWILASMPPQMIKKTVVLFGEPTHFFECKKYDLKEREYEQFSNSFIEAYCNNKPSDKSLYAIVDGFYQEDITEDGLNSIQIEKGTYIIIPPTSQKTEHGNRE